MAGIDTSWQGGLQLTQEDLDIMWDNMLAEDVQVFVNGEVLEDIPAPFVNREAGFVMVPVAYIAEALGYDTYKLSDDELMVGRSMITIGVDSYHYNRMAPVELWAAPELHDDVFFVPLHFFGHVFPYAGYISDGHVFVREFQEEDFAFTEWALYPIIIDGAIGIAADLHTMEDSEFPTHVPLTPVMEALGFLGTMVIADSDPQIVTLEGIDREISFTVGSEEFIVDGETVTLFNYHTAVAVEDEIYVPILFFRDVFGMGSAFWTCGHVHIYTESFDDMN
jgi:hypothetical protein